MVLKYRPKFFRDLAKIKGREKELCLAVENAILNLQNASSISEIQNLKRLEQYEVHYRIKIKLDKKRTFRMGLIIRGNTVWLVRLLHRDKIYKEFP